MNFTVTSEPATQTSSIVHSWLEKPLWRKVTPALLFLFGIMLLSSVLHFINLETLGDANSYYTAAVRSMLQSWHNFFFVAAEPGGSVTVDKPPLGLWIETAFAAILGVSGFVVSLPNILAGIFSIPVLYHLVKKYLGILAGLLAALVLAITPVVLATNRNNTMDGMLVFTLLLAAWAFIKATDSGKFSWLVLGAVLVGLGFNIKMLEAYLPLPAFYALYFLGSKTTWLRKVAYLTAATLILLVVSFSWAVAVDLTPVDQRPYIGSSADNTVMELIIGHNGLNRLFGRDQAPGSSSRPAAAPDGFSQNQSPDDLPQNGPAVQRVRVPAEAIAACSDLSAGESCTVNPANGNTVAGTCAPLENQLVCQPAGVDRPLAGIAPDTISRGGTPFSGEVGSPSILRFFIPPLAKEMSWLLPLALVSLVALAFSTRLHFPLENHHKAFILWSGWLLTCLVFFSMAEFFHAYYMILLAPALGAVVGGGIGVLHEKKWGGWVGWLMAIGFVVTIAFQWWLAIQFGEDTWWLRLAAILVVMGMLTWLVGLLAARQKIRTIAIALMTSGVLVIPLAWSVLTVTSQFANDNLPGAYEGTQNDVAAQTDQRHEQPNAALLAYLQENTQDMEYMLAVTNANLGAPYVLATGRPVLYMGGFTGSDPVVDSEDIQFMVETDELRFVLLSGDRNAGQGISNWLISNCSIVSEFSQQAPASQQNRQQNGGLTLYDCSIQPTTASGTNLDQPAQPGTLQIPSGPAPVVALEACNGHSVADYCSFTAPDGKFVQGTCVQIQQHLVCVPLGGPAARP